MTGRVACPDGRGIARMQNADPVALVERDLAVEIVAVLTVRSFSRVWSERGMGSVSFGRLNGCRASRYRKSRPGNFVWFRSRCHYGRRSLGGVHLERI